MTDAKLLLKKIAYGKLAGDADAVNMAQELLLVLNSQCCLLEEVDAFTDCYLNMIHEFQQHCADQLELDAHGLGTQWAEMVVEDQIEIVLGSQTNSSLPTRCSGCSTLQE